MKTSNNDKALKLIPFGDELFDKTYKSVFLFCQKRNSIIHIAYNENINPQTKLALKFIETEPNKTQIDTEFKILSELSNRYLLRLEKCFTYDEYTCFVTKFASCGTLQDMIDQSRGKPFLDELCQEVMFQLFTAVNYFHQMGYIHRNINPQNILIYSWPADEHRKATIKVALSGFSQSIFLDQEKYTKGKVGIYDYMAPEVYNDQDYTNKADIWSLGVILFQMITGRLPFPYSQKYPIYFDKAIKLGQANFNLLTKLNISSELFCLINNMLQLNPDHRISAGEALKKEWLSSIVIKHQNESLENPNVIEKKEDSLQKELHIILDPNDTFLNEEYN